MGFVLQRLGRLAEAEPYFREAFDKNRRKLGETHPYTLTMLNNLVELLRRQNKLDETETLLREAIEKVRQIEGENHPQSLVLKKSLIETMRRQKKLAESETICAKCSKRLGGCTARTTRKLSTQLGDSAACCADQNKLAEAELFFQESLDKTRRSAGRRSRRYSHRHPPHGNAVRRPGQVLRSDCTADAHRRQSPQRFRASRACFATHLWWECSASPAQALAKQPAEFAVAEANLLEAQSTFAKNRGEQDKRDAQLGASSSSSSTPTGTRPSPAKATTLGRRSGKRTGYAEVRLRFHPSQKKHAATEDQRPSRRRVVNLPVGV